MPVLTLNIKPKCNGTGFTGEPSPRVRFMHDVLVQARVRPEVRHRVRKRMGQILDQGSEYIPAAIKAACEFEGGEISEDWIAERYVEFITE